MSQEKIRAYQVQPGQLACAFCEMEMEGIAPVSAGPSRGLKKGLIAICSNCAGINILAEQGFKTMLPGDVAKLPEQSRNTIYASVAMVKAQIATRPKPSPPDIKSN